MKIGLDKSIAVCRAEGYMVAEYSARAFKRDPMNTPFEFTVSMPAWDRVVGDIIIVGRGNFTYKDLTEVYAEDKNVFDFYVLADENALGAIDVLNLAHMLDSQIGLLSYITRDEFLAHREGLKR